MNRRMERLIPEDEYGSEPAETRKHVNPEHLRIAIDVVAEALERILAEIAKARGAL
jgi:hypothetical protein